MSASGTGVRRAVWGLCAALFCVAAAAQPPEETVLVRVGQVIDGDTVTLARSGPYPMQYVRYLGIDTPEDGQFLYSAAKSANRNLVWRQDVHLELGRERYDAHGRLLAYLWVQADGRWAMVNEELLRQGLARLLVYWPPEEKYYERFRRAVALAQVDKLGLWSTFPDPLPLTTIEADPGAYVLNAVTVVFTVSETAERGSDLVVRAEGSLFGFHVVLSRPVWEGLGLSPSDLVGAEVTVAGELAWERLDRGPVITVWIPEQWEVNR